MIGVALTVALFAFFWVLRGKLNTWGLEYVQWNRTSPLSIVRAIVLGLLAGSRDRLALPQLRNGRSAAVRRAVDRGNLGTAY